MRKARLMECGNRRCLFGARRAALLQAVILGLLLAPAATWGQAPAGGASQTGADIPADASAESLFTDFLHYARMGRFQLAEAYADALLQRPDIDPLAVHAAAQKDKRSLDTLMILIRNSSLGPQAEKVLDLINKGEELKRKDPEQIRANIERLAGNPQQEYFAIEKLAASGEYAIPAMVQALLDPQKQYLRARLVNALGLMERPAVRPLVQALDVDDDDVRLHIIQALGKIGYPQAAPYLSKLIDSDTAPAQTKEAARAALENIVAKSGRPISGSAAEQFFNLGERYYYEDDAVRADGRLPTANVWYWNDAEQLLKAIEVPEPIFGSVMAMRTSEEALLLQNDHAPSLALWLASDIRREHRLGLDVESGDPAEQPDAVDATRPDDFPRALYFTQAAGPRYAHMVLDRAVHDGDSAVALGAIRALRITAGESSLIGTEDYKQPLVQALRFPDLLVRVRAALALGGALPKSPFADAQHVIPLLSTAVTLTGAEHIVVVDGDQAERNRVMGIFRTGDREVIGEASFYTAMDRARESFPAISAVVVGTDITEPDPASALAQLRGEFLYAKTPVVILAEPEGMLMAEDLAASDAYATAVPAAADDAAILAALDRAREKAGLAAVDHDLAMSLALESVGVLRNIALDGRTVYDVGAAQGSLIAALASENEMLRVRAAEVLALLGSAAAQQAIADVALDDGQTSALRIAAFGSLAESAKRFGNMLAEAQVQQLVDIAKDEPDLTMRTAASEALGAVNLATNEASAIVRGYYRG
ncbi:MAG: HEAT repeat domain-containing protein [Phycisphaerae bacterium]|nr:HEAT repeat domain-containing protein [Phycisphaerae bacterium]